MDSVSIKKSQPVVGIQILNKRRSAVDGGKSRALGSRSIFGTRPSFEYKSKSRKGAGAETPLEARSSSLSPVSTNKKSRITLCDETIIPAEGKARVDSEKTLLLGPRPRLKEVINRFHSEDTDLWEIDCDFGRYVWLIGERAGVDFYGGSERWSIERNLNLIQYCAENKMPMTLHGATNKHEKGVVDVQLFIEIGNTCVKEVLVAYINGYNFKSLGSDENHHTTILLKPPVSPKILSQEECELIMQLKAKAQDEFTDEMSSKVLEMINDGFELTTNESCEFRPVK